MADQDYYQILGITKDADAAQIKAAYRDLALKYHPDRNLENPDAANKMKALNEAYAVLSDVKKRKDYDAFQQQYGSSQGYTHFRKSYSNEDIFSGTDIDRVFDELAKSFGFRNFDEISKEFVKGKNQSFDFSSQNVHFKGFFFSGSMNLGSILGSTKKGGILGKAAKILLQNMAGPGIGLQGKNLDDTIQISPDLAKEGGPYAYYHKWQSKKLIVKIPPGIQNGQKIRLSGMGEPGRNQPGDLFLTVVTKKSLMAGIKKFLPF